MRHRQKSTRRARVRRATEPRRAASAQKTGGFFFSRSQPRRKLHSVARMLVSRCNFYACHSEARALESGRPDGRDPFARATRFSFSLFVLKTRLGRPSPTRGGWSSVTGNLQLIPVTTTTVCQRRRVNGRRERVFFRRRRRRRRRRSSLAPPTSHRKDSVFFPNLETANSKGLTPKPPPRRPSPLSSSSRRARSRNRRT